MADDSEFDAWSAGDSYDYYMGRWSREIATAFLEWLGPDFDADWLEIGCGTGALTGRILAETAPASILATDASVDFVDHARAAIDDERVRFAAADARDLPADAASVDVVTSGLVLNFVPDIPAALEEMQRVLRPGGLLSFYVWDYPGGGMGFIDAFWKAAATVDPDAAALDEGQRFPMCTRDGIADLLARAGLRGAQVAPIEITTRFDDFDAFFHPFTLGAGPAPGYYAAQTNRDKARLRDALRARVGDAGPIDLPARAWAAKVTLPG